MARGFLGVNKLAAPNKVQTRRLTSSVTSTGVITDLTFDNLVVGKWYTVHTQIYATDADSWLVRGYHNGVCMQHFGSNVNTDWEAAVYHGTVTFKAAATTFTFEVDSITPGSGIWAVGAGTDNDTTHATLEERNDLGDQDETTDFTP